MLIDRKSKLRAIATFKWFARSCTYMQLHGWLIFWLISRPDRVRIFLWCGEINLDLHSALTSLWAGWDLYSATTVMTRNRGLCILIQETVKFSTSLRQIKVLWTKFYCSFVAMSYTKFHILMKQTSSLVFYKMSTKSMYLYMSHVIVNSNTCILCNKYWIFSVFWKKIPKVLQCTVNILT